jgi:hypothetical protein
MPQEKPNEIKRVTGAQHGDLVGQIEDRVLVPTPYSPAVFPSERTVDDTQPH